MVQVLATADPERFQVLHDGRLVHATLPHQARRALGLHGTPPVTIASELVQLLVEQDAWPGDRDEVALLALAGPLPGFAEELRARLS
ncbi:hypothetical protein FTX61_12950 [Nitriliruptoraceae bacterium ZYF776]|nr:hypothetical protein [Profundirhabdus halotolerans]